MDYEVPQEELHQFAEEDILGEEIDPFEDMLMKYFEKNTVKHLIDKVVDARLFQISKMLGNTHLIAPEITEEIEKAIKKK
ncbi:hypothetical protein [Flavobacterium sp. 3HN19-14]|uniref:hypothetical protein n=1 Tax=Flavobacterium sp. 3HN19-14 TaxID=3448133 RepID=UPI003EDFEF48